MVDQGIKIIEKFYGKLYNEGEKLNQLFFLIEGKVSLYKKDEHGHKVKLPPIESGGFLGLQSLRNTRVSSHSARVCKPSKLLVIPLVYLPDFVKRWPVLKEHIVGQLIYQVDVLNAH